MDLQDGQSEVDTVVLRIPTLDLEIKTWDSYSIRQSFLTPTAAFDFAFSTNQPLLYNEVFVDGVRVDITVNDHPQLSGTIERVQKTCNRQNGMTYKISGRDFLGPVVSASIDPKVKISSGQTVAEFLALVLAPFGIDKIYLSDDINFSVVTGYVRGKGKYQTNTFKVNEAVGRTKKDDKTQSVVYTTKTVTQVVSSDRPDLKKIPLDQLKPKIGDGAMQVIQRLLSRLNLTIWATADGSGVIVDRPRFDREPVHRLIRRFNGEDENNVLDGVHDLNSETQPSCIIAVGKSSGSDMSKVRLKCAAVNELVAVNQNGVIAQSVQNALSGYPGIKVLPLRPELFPLDDRIVSRRKPVPVFVSDDESKNLEQLMAFARRKLAEMQRAYSAATYTVKGHAYADRFPWAMNAMVDVDDDFLSLHEQMWCESTTFSKSRGGGTMTELHLIKPYTMELGT